MERILVSMDARHGAREAWWRAISLAKRIDARVYTLLVLNAGGDTGTAGDQDLALRVRKRLELLIEIAKSEGVRIDYFISEGSYEEEVARFIDTNKITLLVAESPEGESRIRKILHRIKCRVELVSPRKIKQLTPEEGNEHGHTTSSLSTDRGKQC
jgi:nucleotide-binding universal stress UspA family protein